MLYGKNLQLEFEKIIHTKATALIVEFSCHLEGAIS